VITYKLRNGQTYKVAADSANLTGNAALLTVSVINPVNGETINGTARIDSGADISVISTNIASAINSSSISTIQVVGVTGSATSEEAYQVDIDLGSSGYVSGVTVISDSNMAGLGVDMLIGVDILQTGYFEYDGQSGSFTLDVGLPQAPVSGISPAWLWAGVGLAVVGVVGGIVFASYETRQVESAFKQGFMTGEGARY
jgi:predicted aspartyl protease